MSVNILEKPKQNKMKWLLVGLVLFSSCTKSVINVSKPIKEEVIVENKKFVSKSPKLSYPNNSVGQIKNNYYFPGFYMNNDTLVSKYKIDYKKYFDPAKCYGDFDNDGLLDLFAFLWNRDSNPQGSQPGKYLFVSDILGTNPTQIIFDAPIKWMPVFEVNDFNNDGKLEILQCVWDSHLLLDGKTMGTKSPVMIISIVDKKLIIKNIGNPMDIHDMATGDIDKDGDVDILVWDTDGKNAKPILYKNNSVGEFTMMDSYDIFGSLKQILTDNNGFGISSVELADLNGDSYLDIIVGSTINREKIYSYGSYEIPTARIYWGNVDGKFDLLNNYSNLPNETIIGMSIENPDSFLGFSFSDFDNDGDIDVIANVTPNYKGFYLLAYENLGNKQFKDVTKSKINGYVYISKVSSPMVYPSGFDGDFPNFYNIRFYDKDGDGDYDLIPDQIANWGGFKYTNDLYWENVNGNYIRKNL
jgi:hypothetical protein